MLFYQKLSGQLYEWGYEQNPYDPCSFNKTVNDEKLTMHFHVDNLKCSHKDQEVLDSRVKDLNNIFRTSKKELAETKGDIHEYLGLTINFIGRCNPDDYNKTGQVVFTMYVYVEDIIASTPPDMRGIAPDPARSKLFSVHESSLRLNRVEADEFHSMTARLLFAKKRDRPDIQLAVAYLCTRVREPTEDEYLKPARVKRYFRNTVHLPLIIG